MLVKDYKKDAYMAKLAYRVKNWSQYNAALKKRGSLTVWLDEEALAAWYAEGKSPKPGRPLTYSDLAIVCALSIRAVFHLPLRQTEGFLSSLMALSGLDLQVPNYTTLCRRANKLAHFLSVSGDAKHILLDSTGLKVFGEGEWKVRQHGCGKRRTWRKLHLAVNPDGHQIIASCLTTNSVHDSEVVSDLLAGQKNVDAVYADGAYDNRKNHFAIKAIGAKGIIPPRRGAKIQKHGNCSGPRNQRDENIRGVRKLGRKGWKEASGYHVRSLVETAISRLKTAFGDRLRARKISSQASEAFIWTRALNIMTKNGMPKSELVMI